MSKTNLDELLQRYEHMVLASVYGDDNQAYVERVSLRSLLCTAKGSAWVTRACAWMSQKYSALEGLPW